MRRRKRSEDKAMKGFPSAASHRLSSAGVALRGPADAHQEAESTERGGAGAEEAEEGGGGGQEGQTPGGGQEEAAGAETQEEVRALFFFFSFFFSKCADAQSAVCVGRMEWWTASGYRSRCLPPVHSEDDEEEEDDDSSSVSSADSASTDINYVLGDVTHPHMAAGDAIIVHCVGRRRVFVLSDEELRLFFFSSPSRHSF